MHFMWAVTLPWSIGSAFCRKLGGDKPTESGSEATVEQKGGHQTEIAPKAKPLKEKERNNRRELNDKWGGI